MKTLNKLVASVKNKKSDHCATNGVFTELLKDLRAKFLPKVVEQWEDLNDNEKTTLKDMGNFSARFPLVTFDEEANKVLKFETFFLQSKSKYALAVTGEAGSTRLIQSACSAFQKHGHQAAGMTPYFAAYLSDYNWLSLKQSFSMLGQYTTIEIRLSIFSNIVHPPKTTYYMQLCRT